MTSFIVIGTSSQCVFYMLISTHLVLKTILVVKALLFVYDLVICCPHQLTPKYSRVMRSDFDSDHSKWLKKKQTQTHRSGWYLQNCLRCRIKGLRCYWANIRFLKDLIIGCIKVQEMIRGGFSSLLWDSMSSTWFDWPCFDLPQICKKTNYGAWPPYPIQRPHYPHPCCLTRRITFFFATLTPSLLD